MIAIPTELPDCAMPQQPVRNLWSSVILQALADTQCPEHAHEARAWLQGEQCAWICELLGIDHGRLVRRVGA